MKHHKRLGQILNEVQKGSDTTDYIREFVSILGNNAKETITFFISSINRLITVSQVHETVENALEFIAKVLSNLSDSDSTLLSSKLFTKIITHLISCGNSTNNTVRWRACQLFSFIVANFPESIEYAFMILHFYIN